MIDNNNNCEHRRNRQVFGGLLYKPEDRAQEAQAGVWWTPLHIYKPEDRVQEAQAVFGGLLYKL